MDFYEEYHDNCHDYLKPVYIELWAMPEYKKLLYSLMEIPKLNICAEETKGDSIVCDQHAVVFGNANKGKPILATCALNACIAVILYCPNDKTGAIAHFDGLPAYSKESAELAGEKVEFDPIKVNMGMILNKLGKNLKAWLVGGIFGTSEPMLNDIVKFIESVPWITIEGRNLMGPINQTRNISLDLRDGVIRHFDIMNDFDKPKAPNKHPALLDITWNDL